MYRNLYKLLKSQYFLRSFSCQAAWNDGIVECWNIGLEKRKMDYPTRNVESTSFDDARQTSIFWFFPQKHSIKTRRSMKSYAF